MDRDCEAKIVSLNVNTTARKTATTAYLSAYDTSAIEHSQLLIADSFRFWVCFVDLPHSFSILHVPVDCGGCPRPNILTSSRSKCHSHRRATGRIGEFSRVNGALIMLILRIRYDGASANARSARPQMGQCKGVSVMRSGSKSMRTQ